MTRDIPDNVQTQLGDDGGIPGGPNDEGSVATSAHGEGIGAPENEGSVTSGHSREGAGVVTRSRSRFIGKLARSTSGKFPGGDDLSSESRGAELVSKREVESLVSLHSSGAAIREMSGKSCVSLPFLCLGVWGILSALVVVALSYFLHRCSMRSWRSAPSSDCVTSGTQIS